MAKIERNSKRDCGINFDHKECAGHHAALKIENEHPWQCGFKVFKRDQPIKANFFSIAYKVAKANQSFNSFEMEVDLSERNGVDMGCTLNSPNSCISIVNHVNIEMKKIMVDDIVQKQQIVKKNFTDDRRVYPR